MNVGPTDLVVDEEICLVCHFEGFSGQFVHSAAVSGRFSLPQLQEEKRIELPGECWSHVSTVLNSYIDIARDIWRPNQSGRVSCCGPPQTPSNPLAMQPLMGVEPRQWMLVAMGSPTRRLHLLPFSRSPSSSKST